VSDPALGALDALAWLAVHLAAGYAVHRIPAERLRRDTWWSRPRGFERDGAFYEILAPRRWKARLPEAGAAFPGGFDKSRLRSRARPYLERYAAETRRAELGHWLALGAAPFFFLWNPAWLGGCMVVYALAANLPCIVSQRFNRLRLGRLLREPGPPVFSRLATRVVLE
jgi:glycosyl-4,4'-diaponeurosporenoate acyltransferase